MVLVLVVGDVGDNFDRPNNEDDDVKEVHPLLLGVFVELFLPSVLRDLVGSTHIGDHLIIY